MKQQCLSYFAVVVVAVSPQVMASPASDWDFLIRGGVEAYDNGQMERAELCFVKAWKIAKLNPKKDWLARSCVGLSNLYLAINAPAKAQACCSEYLADSAKDTPLKIVILNNLGKAYLDQERARDAEPVLVQALALQTNTPPTLTNDFIVTTRRLASVYAEQRKMKEAAKTYSLLVSVREQSVPDSIELAKDLSCLAFVTMCQNNYSEAEPLFKRSIAILEGQAKCQLELAKSLDGFAELLRNTNRVDEAAAVTERAKVLRIRKSTTDSPI